MLRHEPTQDDQVDQVQRGQQHRGHDRGGEQLAHRLAHDVGQQDDQEARRNDLPERARGADRAARQRRVIAAREQFRQRDQPDGHHGRPDDAGRGPHEHPDDDDGDRHPAGPVAGQMPHHVDRALGDARLLQQHAHEDEQRDRQQRVVGDHAEDAGRQQVEDHVAQADQAEDDAGRGNREGDRHAGEDQHQQGPDHHQRQRIGIHRVGSGVIGWVRAVPAASPAGPSVAVGRRRHRGRGRTPPPRPAMPSPAPGSRSGRTRPGSRP